MDVERDEEGRFTFVAPTGKSVPAEAPRAGDERAALRRVALDYDVAVSGLVAG